MKTIKPNKGCKTLLGIGSPLKFTQNDEHDIVKQAMECLNNFNRKSAGYQLGLIEGYAKALDDVEKVVKRMRAGLIPDRKEWNKGWDNACDFLLDELEEIAKLLKSTNNYQISSSKLAKEKS